ncbi:PREDICTED: uncharacterized protein LOC104710008 [Camelina sativa]|uniref:Uncharacterized protein LOC104710008 n=3 Tax=Camelina sativa TaxID=90675 RepID=A0ABM0TDN2_CAMSA|nr:PREDICTED: uncharacterized protein LOC104710008 [Camelina sativa]
MANYGSYVANTCGNHAAGEASGSHSRHSPVPDSQASQHAPMEMTIEDFVSQPGRELIPRLDPYGAPNTTWFCDSHNGITKSLLRMMYGILKTPYAKFSVMPSSEQEMWFKQFAQDFTWHPDITNNVRKEFKKAAARQYSKMLNEWKQKWKKGKVPKGLSDDLFQGLIQYWGEVNTVSLSSKYSQNRRSDRGGLGMATHNNGPVSAYTRQRQLTIRDGVVPDHITLMEDMHTNKKTKQIQDGRAKLVVESSRRRQEEIISSQQSSEGSESTVELGREKLNEIFYEETEKNKGRIFGLGNLSQQSPLSQSTGYSFAPTQEFQQALQEKDARIAALEKEMEEQKAENKRRDEENKKRDEDLAAFMSEMRARHSAF